jgi:hypothetical protein
VGAVTTAPDGGLTDCHGQNNLAIRWQRTVESPVAAIQYLLGTPAKLNSLDPAHLAENHVTVKANNQTLTPLPPAI